jgi:N-acetylmuramoyl-L-alanine amidase
VRTRRVALAGVLTAILVLCAFGTAPAGVVVARAAGERWAEPASLRPHIVWHPFTYGPRRRAEMAAYSRRHYGTASWHLVDPQVIVEHYTAGTSVTSVFNYYEANSPHMGELPGVCAHFLIDTDGTIYQEASLAVRCRHVIGINYTAIGIEHVGTSDAQILRNAAMMRSSLRLTVWLMAKFHIQARNVIGHAESLMSPYHHEAYASWRCLTHADWLHRDMQTYRTRLRARARAAGVPVGPKPEWVHSAC